ncbi:MAG: winged helix-turn-helix transcriptional regulator [Lachnospiraceae bacterium]|uniref:ArsR/SmtB family transcription factor n=1 Tax=uncultured Acetatifactor sp. TaxID=1671927 RepID=UPI002606C68E|nr:helix-turn-helix domain-containing protein [uncultured Acetatifactor sp.]MCI8789401.1 winged helix-turn-helix transcriptional regulator [Lachnospiraceae bacterium]
MTERDYGKEIDALREQLENLQDMVQASLPNKPSAKKLESVQVMQGMHPDSRLSDLMEELCHKTEERNGSGLVSYLGIYQSGGRQSNWIRSTVPTEDLLSLIESGIASKVLACIGNPNRLAILLEILRGPKSVTALVEKCGFGSTGQVYHHMKPLLAADIVVEDEHQKGFYVIQPHKVQGVIMLLTGISDMVDETFTKGTWNDAEEN